jgi:hypothetical protein
VSVFSLIVTWIRPGQHGNPVPWPYPVESPESSQSLHLYSVSGRTGCFQSYLQMVSTELKEYAEVSACQRITENNRIITDFQKGTKSSLYGLLEKILQPANLNNATGK